MELDRNSLAEKGKEIYRNNEHYRRLANVMEHPEMKAFFDTYMQDIDTAKTILLFMKIYDAIGKRVELSAYEKLAIVKEVIDNAETRRKVCEGLEEWFAAGKEGPLRIGDSAGDT